MCLYMSNLKGCFFIKHLIEIGIAFFIYLEFPTLNISRKNCLLLFIIINFVIS